MTNEKERERVQKTHKIKYLNAISIRNKILRNLIVMMICALAGQLVLSSHKSKIQLMQPGVVPVNSEQATMKKKIECNNCVSLIYS
jgi:hypothetical protein